MPFLLQVPAELPPIAIIPHTDYFCSSALDPIAHNGDETVVPHAVEHLVVVVAPILLAQKDTHHERVSVQVVSCMTNSEKYLIFVKNYF